MAQVNSVNSTSMPVVQSRRRFLSHAAGVAAGGTVLALAVIPPAPSVAAPASPLDAANASPALRAATIALDEAHGRLKEANAAFSADDATVTRWRELNPKPTGRRAVKNWERRYRDYRHSVTMDSWHASMDAEDAFRTAQWPSRRSTRGIWTSWRLRLPCLAFTTRCACAPIAPMPR